MKIERPEPGKPVQLYEFSSLDGGTLRFGGASDHWTLFVVYRGRHCPRCKTYLNQLEAMSSRWEDAGFRVLVVSADTEEKARADREEFGWAFDLGYGLTEAQMRDLGLYVSEPLSPQETDRRFAEPGVFVTRPDGTLLLVNISNGPSSRPDLEALLDGMIFTKANDRPPRGMA